MTKTHVFSEAEMEAFKELGNVGAGHAAIALTKLFSQEVDMSVPFIRSGTPEEILSTIELQNEDLVGFALTEVNEPLRYRLSVLFKETVIISVLKLLSSTSKSKITAEDDLTDMQKSLVQEIGSTIVLRYIAALNKMLKVESMPDIAPEFKLKSAVNALNEVVYTKDEELIMVQLDLFTEEAKFECHLFIQPHHDSVDAYRQAFFM
ncbi:MAG: chemotaxis protein CheC [Candidatus Kariarchaeaceae archaeon]|jgi:chemotaxis protein CheC